MQITFAVEVGRENRECMQYNNVVIMHTCVGKIYMVSKREKNNIVRNGRIEEQVVERFCGHSRWV